MLNELFFCTNMSVCIFNAIETKVRKQTFKNFKIVLKFLCQKKVCINIVQPYKHIHMYIHTYHFLSFDYTHTQKKKKPTHALII